LVGPEIDEARIAALCDQLLDELDPVTTPPRELLGRQFDLGLAWVHFPVGHGGLGAAPGLQRIVDARMEAVGAPQPVVTNVIGYGMGAPTIATHGTEAQKRRYLRPLFTCEEIWCQLFSEPGAGSDVAGLATRAVRDGDEWVVNGQKVWTTLAHQARWGLLVARTDPDVPKHRGLTYFVVDMQAPGVEVKPLFQITGEAEFNEVFFTDVRVPDSERLSEPGDGWRVVLTTLMNERATIGGGSQLKGEGLIGDAVEAWRASGCSDPARRDQLARLWVDAEVHRLTNLRAAELRLAGNPGPEGSIGKIALASIHQAVTEFTLGLLGPAGTLMPAGYPMARPEVAMDWGDPQQAFLRARANSIEGGTSEISKNILAERVLGLPGDVRSDKDLPWRDVPR
jgi:alkylation response protein AidB-like acyl-CoA dehydrogenase